MTTLYESEDCTGPAYSSVIDIGLSKSIAVGNSDALFYVDESATATSITYGSYYDFSPSRTGNPMGCTQYDGGQIMAYPLTPNNPAVTGVNSATFPTPITIERR
jgi:hypothetical protein